MADCDFQALLSAAKCADCYNSHQLRMIIAQLLCDIEGDLSGGALGGLVLAPWQTVYTGVATNFALNTHTRLGSVTVRNDSQSTRYLQIYVGVVVPNPAALAVIPVPVYAGTTGGLDFGDCGISTPGGILAVVSSTQDTYTSTPADCRFTLQVK